MCSSSFDNNCQVEVYMIFRVVGEAKEQGCFSG